MAYLMNFHCTKIIQIHSTHQQQLAIPFHASSFVTLKVYDVLGNEIATLVNEEKPEGSYEIKFRCK